MKKEKKESKQESKRGFTRCTFRTNLAIGFCVSFPIAAFTVFIEKIPPSVDGFVLKQIAIVLVLGTMGAFFGGGFSWLMFDFE